MKGVSLNASTRDAKTGISFFFTVETYQDASSGSLSSWAGGILK
jgi:hypothetical protein